MQDVIKSPKLLLAIAIAALTGCSSGSSDDSSAEQAPAATSQSVNGEAVKGIMASAIVKAYSLDGSTLYGTTQTAADGTYTLAGITAGAGPVLVELTTDADTQMTCDSATGCTQDGTTHTFGSRFTFDDPDFKLTAVLPGIASGATSGRLMITPVTHMAAQRALATGATTAEEIEGVNRATARLLGLDNVDITSITPSDITNSGSADDDAAAQRYGALVAAFATIAETSGGDIEAAIRQITDDFAQDGSMKANTTVDGELALANIFGAAQQSAEKAQQSGVNLGNTGATLALETQEAESAPADSVVTPEEEEETPSGLMTEEEATEAGIALLNDLNNWYQALNNSDVEAKGDMYAAQIEAAAELLPAFSAADSELQTWKKLVLSYESRCVSTGWAYNSETDTFTSFCAEYGDVAIPGPLTMTLPVAGWLGQFAQYIEENHANLAFTDNEDGTYSLSTDDLGEMVNGLDIAEFLTDDEGSMVEGAAVYATYSMTGNKIGEISFYGTGEELQVGSSEHPVTLAYEQSGSTLTYTLSGLELTPVTPEDHDVTAISIPAAAVVMSFASENDASAFIPAIDNSEVINPATITSVTAAFAGHAESADSSADFTINAAYTSPTETTRGLSVELSLTGNTDNDSSNEISGTLSVELNGDYAQEGDMTDGYSVTIENVSGTAEFDGHIEAGLEDGSSVSFSGSLSADATGISDNSSAPSETIAVAQGSLEIVDNREGTAATITFDGTARLKEKALQTPAGDTLIIDGEVITHPYEIYLDGELSATEQGNTATIAIDGLATINNLDAFRVAPPSLPEDGSMIPVSIPMQLDGPDTVLFATSTLEAQLVNALGVTTDATNWISLNLPESVHRVLNENDPQFPEDDFYELIFEYQYYTNRWSISDLNYYAEVTLSPTDDLREIVEVAIASGIIYPSFDSSFDIESGDIYVWGSTWNGGVSVSEDHEIVINSFVRTYIDAGDVILSAETEDMYRNISLALNVDATATGLDEAAIRILAQRTGLEDVAGSIQLSYNSTDASVKRVIDLQLNSAEEITDGEFNYLTVADADTEMKIHATCVSDEEMADCGEFEFTGVITVADQQVGVLESRDGVPVFKFGNEDRYRILTPNFLVEKVAD